MPQTSRPDRGVFVAPFLGPNGETVLLPIMSDRRLATDGPVYVAGDADALSESDRLWGLLDKVDPAEDRSSAAA